MQLHKILVNKSWKIIKKNQLLNEKTYTLTISSSLRIKSGSLAIGEKWQMQLLTDMHVGKAIPFLSSFSFLKTLLVSSVSILSPNSHISLTEDPATHLFRTCFNTPRKYKDLYQQFIHEKSQISKSSFDIDKNLKKLILVKCQAKKNRQSWFLKLVKWKVCKWLPSNKTKQMIENKWFWPSS